MRQRRINLQPMMHRHGKMADRTCVRRKYKDKLKDLN